MVIRAARKRLTLAQQALALAKAFPDHRPIFKRGRLVWVVDLRPSALSTVYKVRLEYRPGSLPQITIVEPVLRRVEGKPLPHTFEGDLLCLNYPWEWLGDEDIASTIAPWISEWLFYYELWVITGRWLGGGHGHEDDEVMEPSC